METKIKKRQALATEILSYVTKKTRDNGRDYYFLDTDDYNELTFAVHNNGDMFPDDYRYEFLVKSLEIIQNYDDDEYYAEGIDQAVSIYTYALTDWLTSSIGRINFVENAVNSGIISTEDFNLVAAMQAGQYSEIEEVLNIVINWIDDQI